MNIVVVPRGKPIPISGISTAYLKIDHWNDFSFVTMFDLRLFDEQGIFMKSVGSKLASKVKLLRKIPTVLLIQPSSPFLKDTFL